MTSWHLRDQVAGESDSCCSPLLRIGQFNSPPVDRGHCRAVLKVTLSSTDGFHGRAAYQPLECLTQAFITDASLEWTVEGGLIHVKPLFLRAAGTAGDAPPPQPRAPSIHPIPSHPTPSYSPSVSSRLQETDATDSRRPYAGNTNRHHLLNCNIMGIVCPQNMSVLRRRRTATVHRAAFLFSCT